MQKGHQMEYQPTNFDTVMQQALDVLRDFVGNHKVYKEDGSISMSVPTLLKNNGFSNSDAQNAYSGLKRIGLVSVVKNGRASVLPTITVDMNTSVVQRRIEAFVSKKKRQRLTGDSATLANIDLEIEDTQKRLKKLQRDRDRVLAKIEEDSTQLQPTK